jgi:hypothetical protein
MAVIVGVHGIAQQLKGPDRLREEWAPDLRDGLRLAGATLPDDGLVCASYGALFRPPGRARAAAEHFGPHDVDEHDAALLEQLWLEAARVDRGVVSPDAEVRAATPKSIQAALRALSRSRFFANMAEAAFIGSLKQVTRYLHEDEIRSAAQESVDAVVTEDTRVIVAHSLGSVVAYESLHRFGMQPNWSGVRTLVTLGSPLGVPNVIFNRLRPAPDQGKSVPPPLDRWTNISDDGDVVALVKKLSTLFGDLVVDIGVDNGATVHKIGPYLSAVETGRAIADGLS